MGRGVPDFFGSWACVGRLRLPSARLAVAAADNRPLAPVRAAGIARVKSAKFESASGRANRLTLRQGLRVRAISAVPPGCALRPSAVAALADGRRSGGFTPKATVAARHVNGRIASAISDREQRLPRGCYERVCLTYARAGCFLPKPVACSKACAICKMLKSALWRPTTCTPTGSPSGVKPPGTEAAGLPVAEIYQQDFIQSM